MLSSRPSAGVADAGCESRDPCRRVPWARWVPALRARACLRRLRPLGRDDAGGASHAPIIAPSEPSIPLIAAVLPESAFAAANAIEAVDRLDARDELGVLVADVTFDPQTQRRAVLYRQRTAVHFMGENGLGVEGIEQVDAFVVEAA